MKTTKDIGIETTLFEVLIAKKPCSSKRPNGIANFLYILHLKSVRVLNEM